MISRIPFTIVSWLHYSVFSLSLLLYDNHDSCTVSLGYYHLHKTSGLHKYLHFHGSGTGPFNIWELFPVYFDSKSNCKKQSLL